MNTSFFGELLQTISERGRKLIAGDRRGDAAARSASLVELCEELLSGRGEASGVALAREILTRYDELTTGPRIAFFEALATRFGVDRERIDAAVDAWTREGSDEAAVELHLAAEPRRQELFRRINLAPGGTAALVAMREDLMDAMVHRDDLAAVDQDFVHLFSSWFNRGFLVLRHIDWSTPAIILEKIIRYEAVHQIRDWDDLRRRIDPPDRRCYAFFHPALNDEPLIFVEVAFTGAIPNAIGPILEKGGNAIAPERATTAVFYSISNCQRGLTGVSFGSFLIKQVVEEVSREFARLSNFVTLSPVPGFANWLARERRSENPTADGGRPERDRRAGPARLVAGRRRRAAGRAAAARGRDLFHQRQGARRPAARSGGALPPRQWRAARAAQLPRRPFGEGPRAIARPDGELSVRSRRHREEPRGLRGEPHRGGGERDQEARKDAEGVGEGVVIPLSPRSGRSPA